MTPFPRITLNTRKDHRRQPVVVFPSHIVALTMLNPDDETQGTHIAFTGNSNLAATIWVFESMTEILAAIDALNKPLPVPAPNPAPF